MLLRIAHQAIFVAAVAICSPGQDTAVAELSKEDSAKAAELYKRLRAAQEDWQSFREKVRDEYGQRIAKELPQNRRMVWSFGYQPSSRKITIPTEWADGIEFSADFRFVVPKRR